MSYEQRVIDSINKERDILKLIIETDDDPKVIHDCMDDYALLGKILDV